MMKNQNTTMRKTMYHNQRHPCLAAMLFMRRKVPERMPDVSEKASFCAKGFRVRHGQEPQHRNTHHLAELDGRVADFVPNANRDLEPSKGFDMKAHIRNRMHSHPSIA